MIPQNAFGPKPEPSLSPHPPLCNGSASFEEANRQYPSSLANESTSYIAMVSNLAATKPLPFRPQQVIYNDMLTCGAPIRQRLRDMHPIAFSKEGILIGFYRQQSSQGDRLSLAVFSRCSCYDPYLSLVAYHSPIGGKKRWLVKRIVIVIVTAT